MTPINSTLLSRIARCWREAVFFFSTILVSFVVMLPRLASPQFGLLDDGVTIRGARGVIENWHIVFHLGGQTGRFFPAYWLFYSLLYLIGGANPFFWFIANYLALLGITTGLIYFVRLRGGSRLQGWAAGFLFILSGPIVENAYTLSKPEPIQLMWITISLLLITLYNRVENCWKRAFLILGTCIALFLSNVTKETSLAMIPISLGWFLVACRWSNATNNEMHFKRWFLLASLIAGSAFFGLRSYFVPLSFSEGAYTSFYRLEWQRVLVSVSRWVAWLIRDFPYLAPLIIFIGVSHVLRKQSQGRLLLDTAIWMLGWIAIFLPWHSLLEYYLLPFTFGCAVLGGIGFGQALSSLRLAKKSVRMMAGFCLGLSLWMWPSTLINNVTNARLQLAVDAVNSEMIDFLTTVPAKSVVLVNIPEPNEYVYELGVHLSEIKQRPDISVEYFKFQVASPGERDLSYYVATPQMENQTLPSVRIAVHEAGAEQWNQSLQSFLGDKMEMVYQVERHVQLLDFGFHRVMCIFTEDPDAGIYCKVPRPFINGQVFSYGWKIYQVSSNIYSIALPAVFLPDGTLEFQLPDGSTKQLHFGQPGDVPLAGDWDGDGFSEVGIFSPANLAWYLDYDVDGKFDVEFRFTGMRADDIPLAGDWDGNNTATPGYFRPGDVSWHFRNSNTSGGEDWPVIQLGVPTDIPIIGDWDGDGRATIGIYRPDNGEIDLKNGLTPEPAQVVFSASPKSIPVVADWGGQGFDSIAFVADSHWFRRFVNCNCWPSNPAVPFEFGSPKDIPLAGRWEIKE